MIQILTVIAFIIITFGGMALALHFSKYKRRPSGCCGGGHCVPGEQSSPSMHSCYQEKREFVENYSKGN